MSYQFADEWDLFPSGVYFRHAVDVAIERVVARQPRKKEKTMIRLQCLSTSSIKDSNEPVMARAI